MGKAEIVVRLIILSWAQFDSYSPGYFPLTFSIHFQGYNLFSDTEKETIEKRAKKKKKRERVVYYVIHV